MQHVMPSNNHPRIFLLVHHTPSPLSIFFSDIGCLPWLPVTSGGGKMSLMAMRMDCDAPSSTSLSLLWIRLQKLSTCNSMMFTKGVQHFTWFGMVHPAGSVRCSSGCGASRLGSCLNRSWAMSWAVLVVAQKNGGLFVHPICSDDGMTSIVGSLLLSLGST